MINNLVKIGSIIVNKNISNHFIKKSIFYVFVCNKFFSIFINIIYIIWIYRKSFIIIKTDNLLHKDFDHVNKYFQYMVWWLIKLINEFVFLDCVLPFTIILYGWSEICGQFELCPFNIFLCNIIKDNHFCIVSLFC